MKNKIIFILALGCLCTVFACEKVIELDLRDDAGRLVIEGELNNLANVQTIRLSRTLPFTSENNAAGVSGAAVSVSDEAGNNYIFRETAIGIYTSQELRGISGNRYRMRVVDGETIYQASSVMPARVELDSVSSRPQPFDNGSNSRQISVHYRDPVGRANQYRFMLYRNNVLIRRPFVSNDQLSDGREVRFDLRLVGDDPDIFPGDQITVEMQCIDLPIYTYWYSLRQQSLNGSGGGVSPSDPPGNIEPAALGYFSAHTLQRKSITVR